MKCCDFALNILDVPGVDAFEVLKFVPFVLVMLRGDYYFGRCRETY